MLGSRLKRAFCNDRDAGSAAMDHLRVAGIGGDVDSVTGAQE